MGTWMQESSDGRHREDVRERLLNRKRTNEVVVKCCLSSRILNAEVKEEIQNRVLQTSKIVHRGSLLFNRLLLHCLQTNSELPPLDDQTFFRQCFTMGIELAKTRSKFPPLQDLYSTAFHSFPRPERCSGDSNTLVYAAKKYMTNFHTMLITTFETRQKKFLNAYGEEHGLTREVLSWVRYAINGWNHTSRNQLPDSLLPFIQTQRALLGLGEVEELTSRWLETNPNALLKYYYSILQYYTEHKKPLFTLAPIARIRNTFITIDTTVLYEILKAVNLFEKSLKEFMDLRDDHWRSIFVLEGLKSKGDFTYLVETDGVGLCVHFRIPKRQPPSSSRPATTPQRVIAIDPGRCNLLCAVERKQDGTLQTWNLSRKTYYQESGYIKALTQANRWNVEIQDVLEPLSKVSPKTIQSEEWSAYQTALETHYDALWKQYTTRKWGRSRMNTYSGKRRTLDTFFSSFQKKGEEKPVIAYGAAKFNPTSKHELSAPTTYLSKRCSQHYETHFVDEYNTSKMCSCCGKELTILYKKSEDGKVRQLRGLRWCGSTSCCKFLNRDKNAAENIRMCFVGGAIRPNSLSRNSVGVSLGESKRGRKSSNLTIDPSVDGR
jgi:hypothetical protein